MTSKAPNPTKLGDVSPTLANDLLDCPYRVAWRLDGRFKYLRRPNTRSELGRIAHQVVEDVGRGLLRTASTTEETRALVEQSWEGHQTESVKVLSDHWAPSVPPKPEDWPGFFVTKTRVIRRAIRLSQNRESPPGQNHHSSIERPLIDAESGLKGRPDRVETRSGSVVVVDLKTGLGQKDPSVGQRRQLLVYAFLVNKETDQWPDKVAIEDASGRRWEEPVVPDEASRIVEEIIQAKEGFNGAVESKVLRELAAPASETCRWCTYRPVCDAYWESLTTEWQHGSVAGRLASDVAVGTNRKLTIVARSPVNSLGRTWTVTAGNSPRHEGSDSHLSVTVTDAQLTETPRFLRTNWMSSVSTSSITSV